MRFARCLEGCSEREILELLVDDPVFLEAYRQTYRPMGEGVHICARLEKHNAKPLDWWVRQVGLATGNDSKFIEDGAYMMICPLCKKRTLRIHFVNANLSRELATGWCINGCPPGKITSALINQ